MEILEHVWGTQPGKYMCISTKRNGQWRDRFFETIPQALEFVSDAQRSGDQVDLYWAPMKFTEPKRRKENVASVKFLWQDLDYCDPLKIDAALRPSIAWESSPGRFHALWELTEAVELSRQTGTNRALAYYLAPKGADKGGWDATQVLRIPGTLNHKYSPPPQVKLLWHENQTTPLQVFRNRLDADDPVDVEDRSGSADFDSTLLKHRKRIPRKVMTLLLADEATEGRRSDILWYIGHELTKAGVSVPEVYILLKGSVWNKYAGRADEEERLHHEIARALEDEVIDGGKKPPKLEIVSDEEDLQAYELDVQTDDELMGDLSTYPGWLVEGFWTRRSHGIVAGEPKSFKSTLLTDFAVSVASGKPFLGQFEVHDQGPVLFVQNENATWIMRDRLEKIRAGKGLIGEVRNNKHGVTVGWPPRLPIYWINQQGFSLSDPIHRKAIEKLVTEIRPVVVIFDPLYLMFDGDLNTAKDLNPALQWLLSLKNRFNTGVILVHHWNKNGSSSRGGQRMLGSTTLHGWIESAWYLRVGGDSNEEKPEGDEVPEDADRESVQKSGALAQITVEREFRGAGSYPKADITLKMGGFGEALYEVEVAKHKPPQGKKEKKAAKDDDLRVEILHTLDLHQERLSVRRISEEVGVGQRKVKDLLTELENMGRVEYVGTGRLGGWVVRRER